MHNGSRIFCCNTNRTAARSGSRPYVPTVQEGAAKSGTMFAEMPEPRCPPANVFLVVFRPHSGSSRPTPRRCWRSLGPPPGALGDQLNNNKNNDNNCCFFINLVSAAHPYPYPLGVLLLSMSRGYRTRQVLL